MRTVRDQLSLPSGGRGEDEPGETVNKEPEKKPRQKRKRASTGFLVSLGAELCL